MDSDKLYQCSGMVRAPTTSLRLISWPFLSACVKPTHGISGFRIVQAIRTFTDTIGLAQSFKLYSDVDSRDGLPPAFRNEVQCAGVTLVDTASQGRPGMIIGDSAHGVDYKLLTDATVQRIPSSLHWRIRRRPTPSWWSLPTQMFVMQCPSSGSEGTR